ncbi:hypothetical protein BMS3Bbin01_03031 [bacterium BMS3Bbin01]|nr:hypothetical protein BMS3Bbin01_03031 [bacterium BMS3Bbin01]
MAWSLTSMARISSSANHPVALGAISSMRFPRQDEESQTRRPERVLACSHNNGIDLQTVHVRVHGPMATGGAAPVARAKTAMSSDASLLLSNVSLSARSRRTVRYEAFADPDLTMQQISGRSALTARYRFTRTRFEQVS